MALPRTALALALGVLLLTPQPAAAGGWASWIQVDPKTVAPGQRVEVRAEAWFRKAAAAKAAQEPGRFYVYLLRDFDFGIVEKVWSKPSPGDWWSLGGAEAIQVGPVTVRVPPSNVGTARAEFTVPELPPGTYHLMLWDAGCATPLGTVIPAWGFTVVADPATAELAQRVESLERRIHGQARELRGAHARADRALDEARGADSEVEQLEARVTALIDEDRRFLGTPWVYAAGLVAVVLAGALVLRIARGRGPRPPKRDGLDEPHVSDEELRDLISSVADSNR